MVGGARIHLISVHIIPQNFVAFQHGLGAPTNKNIHPMFTLQSEGDMSAKLIEASSLSASKTNNNNARRTGFSSRTAGEILSKFLRLLLLARIA